jgi:hypothetical protein
MRRKEVGDLYNSLGFVRTVNCRGYGGLGMIEREGVCTRFKLGNLL